jgi:predicted aspartyl protease
MKIDLINKPSGALRINIKIWIPSEDKYADTISIFDTGASKTVIDVKLAELLGISTAPAPDTVTAAGEIPTENGILEKMRIGEKTISKVPVSVMRLPEKLEARCLLGMNVLREFDVAIKNHERKIELLWKPLGKQYTKDDYSVTAVSAEV